MNQYQPLAADDPRRLGAYDLVGRLGEGGQGIVYLGRSDSGEQVAIKLLHHASVADPEARSRFLREVTVAQRVARFCTAPVLDADLEGSRPYLVSEFVPGPSLRDLVINEGARRGAALDRLAISTATALAAIHRAGILHRDFKPANVLMGPEGPVVIDFGIARALDSPGATATGMAVGTPSYLSPEQLSGGVVSEAADVFAWGVTMVYAATGRPAFGADSIPVVMNRILNEEPQLGGMEGTLAELVASCLSKDPTQRPSADELIVRLTGQPAPHPGQEGPSGQPAAANGQPVGGSAPGGGQVPPQGVRPEGVRPVDGAAAKRRRPLTLALSGAGVAALLVVAGAVVVRAQSGDGTHALWQTGNIAQDTPSDGSGAGRRAEPPSTGTGVPTAQPVATPDLDQGESAKTKQPDDHLRQVITVVPTAQPEVRPTANPTPHRPEPKPAETQSADTRHPGDNGAGPDAEPTGEPTQGPDIVVPSDAISHGTAKPTRMPTTRPSAKPTPKPTPKPTVKPTTRPTVKPTTAPKPNPYSAAQVCGAGYKVVDSHALGGNATIYLMYDAGAGRNCVMTLSRYVHPGKVAMNALLQVKGGPSGSDPGRFTAYAGPIRLPAQKKCVIWGGSWGAVSWKSGWSHCG